MEKFCRVINTVTDLEFYKQHLHHHEIECQDGCHFIPTTAMAHLSKTSKMTSRTRVGIFVIACTWQYRSNRRVAVSVLIHRECAPTLTLQSKYVQCMCYSKKTKNINIRMYRNKLWPVVLYGYETWLLTLREERRLRVFENKVLRRIFGPKRDEVTRERRKLNNEELNDL